MRKTYLFLLALALVALVLYLLPADVPPVRTAVASGDNGAGQAASTHTWTANSGCSAACCSDCARHGPCPCTEGCPNVYIDCSAWIDSSTGDVTAVKVMDQYVTPWDSNYVGCPNSVYTWSFTVAATCAYQNCTEQDWQLLTPPKCRVWPGSSGGARIPTPQQAILSQAQLDALSGWRAGHECANPQLKLEIDADLKHDECGLCTYLPPTGGTWVIYLPAPGQ